MKILVTGTAGFIGFHLANTLLERGHEVVGLDSINDYYDVRLKYDRLEQAGIAEAATEWNRMVNSTEYPHYRFVRMQLEDAESIGNLFAEESFDRVCHLAAQAGLKNSFSNPRSYVDSNMYGFLNILEACRQEKTPHLVFASSSSVYGLNEKMPFSTADPADHPTSLYAASKKSNELMAHSYSHLFGLPATGLRFFTVYGPWGRPDMVCNLFADAIVKGQPLQVFNYGNMQRDFTFVGDIVDCLVRITEAAPPAGDPDWNAADPDPASSAAPYRVYNIGHGEPVALAELIALLEEMLGRQAIQELLPMRPGDIASSNADVAALYRDFQYQPQTAIRQGLRAFVDWYTAYYLAKQEEIKQELT